MGTAFALVTSSPTMKTTISPHKAKPIGQLSRKTKRKIPNVPKLMLPLETAQNNHQYTAGSNHAHYYSSIHKIPHQLALDLLTSRHNRPWKSK